MSLNNTSQQEEAAQTVVAPPAVEQSIQIEGLHLEEPPAAAAAPQADSLSSPSSAPELIEPHQSGPETKVPAVSPATRTGPGPQPAVLTACLLAHAFHLLSA